MSLSKLMKVARESVDSPELTPEELAVNAEAIEDTGITVDVIDEVQAPAADLDTGLADVEAAEAEAESLDNTAAAFTASLDAGEGEAPGQGVDPVAAEMAADQIAAAVERFGLAAAGTRPARESFATSEGRRGVTRSLAKEAEDTAKSLRERAIAAIKKAIEWLQDLIKTAFDKAYRIEKRAKALAAAAKQSKAKGGQELKINASFLGTESVSVVARNLAKLAKPLTKLGDAVTGSGTVESMDLNPDNVGNVSLKLVEANDKLEFKRETGEAAETKVTALPQNVAGTVANDVAAGVKALTSAKADFDKLTKNSLSLIGAIKTEGGVGDRAKAVSSVTACTRAAAAVLSVGLGTASRLLDIVDASLKAKEATADAGAAAGAAA